MRARFAVAFPDFDYEKLAKECGATCAYQNDEGYLIVTGTLHAIETLATNLGYGPDGATESRRTTAMPLYVLSNEQLVQIARSLQDVENELSPEDGGDEATKQCVMDLLEELDRRGDSYRLAGSKIRRV